VSEEEEVGKEREKEKERKCKMRGFIILVACWFFIAFCSGDSIDDILASKAKLGYIFSKFNEFGIVVPNDSTVFAVSNNAAKGKLKKELALKYLLKSDEPYIQPLAEQFLQFQIATEVLSKDDLKDRKDDSVTTLAPLYSISPLRTSKKINGDAKVIDSIEADESPTGFLHITKDFLRPDAPFMHSIFDVLNKEGLQNLADLLEAVDVSKLLEGTFFSGVGDFYTLFAPSEIAFEDIDGTETERYLSKNPILLLHVLLHHLTIFPYTVDDLEGMSSVDDVLGNSLSITNPGGNLEVENVEIVESFNTFNGPVHVINAILLPVDFPTTTAYEEAQNGPAGEYVFALEQIAEPILNFGKKAMKPGSRTFLVFTDAAINSFNSEWNVDWADLVTSTNNRKQSIVNAIMASHILKEPLTRSEIENGKKNIKAIGGFATSRNRIQFVDGMEDITVLNGIVHFVDDVILNKCARFKLKKLNK